MKVQRVEALVEEIAVRLQKQTVPPRQGEWWLGQQKQKVCNQRKGRECVQVQVVPRMTKRILKDGPGVRDKRAIKGQFRVEARRKKVDRRVAPNAK